MADIDVTSTNVAEAGFRRAEAIIDLLQIAIDEVGVVEQSDCLSTFVLDVEAKPNAVRQIDDASIVHPLRRSIDGFDGSVIRTWCWTEWDWKARELPVVGERSDGSDRLLGVSGAG